VDNGCTDDSKAVINSLNEIRGNRIRYYYESQPGLHMGRHKGAKEARGKILTYCDDDIVAENTWLEGIYESFQDPEVVLVGGKIMPLYEGEVPDWLNSFWTVNEYGRSLGYLSLLDFGNEVREIPSYYVYGCNFSIRKDILFKLGGFNPDSMPQDLIRFRGDGESALSLKIMEKGYKVVYNPKASIKHRVPKERMTIEYFCKRSFNQGISDSFTEIRKNNGIKNNNIFNDLRVCIKTAEDELKYFLKRLKKKDKIESIRHKVKKAYLEGREYHQLEVKRDKRLLDYVLKESWLYE
jgi:glycosyltransferase involved in cell wall biosynthesis